MTVKELIDKLKEMPQEAMVLTECADYINDVVKGSEYVGFSDSEVFLEV